MVEVNKGDIDVGKEGGRERAHTHIEAHTHTHLLADEYHEALQHVHVEARAHGGVADDPLDVVQNDHGHARLVPAVQ